MCCPHTLIWLCRSSDSVCFGIVHLPYLLPDFLCRRKQAPALYPKSSETADTLHFSSNRPVCGIQTCPEYNYCINLPRRLVRFFHSSDTLNSKFRRIGYLHPRIHRTHSQEEAPPCKEHRQGIHFIRSEEIGHLPHQEKKELLFLLMHFSFICRHRFPA